MDINIGVRIAMSRMLRRNLKLKSRPHIEDHDFYVKMKNASKFLGEGNKVKVTIMFRGRELSHPELGMAVLTRFAEELKETASIEKAAKLEGRNMTMILESKNNRSL